MSAWRQFLQDLRDSPSFGRDRANLISAFSIGTTALLLNAVVMLLLLPLMLFPDDRDFATLTQNIEFGQLLALILLGGAAAFATFLIPLRLVTVLWGPRIGRYFDQVVLSGITPLRFLIGKATSQNLFVALILFLLLPWLVLILTVGGVEWTVFLANLAVVWLYCMALALVMLWLSLYFNELLAMLLVTGGAVVFAVLGCIPMPYQPFVVTPFPVLLHGVYTRIPELEGWVQSTWFTEFVASVLALSGVIVASLVAITIGPLYGIIRENSTFGEVVRSGDSRRKRWFRLRYHIQRPSEIAFFYENRGLLFRRCEGLLRWGVVFCGLTLLSLTASAALMLAMVEFQVVQATAGRAQWWIYDFHATTLAIHAVGVALAVFLFSHTLNTTWLEIPLIAGRRVRVATLDTLAFATFLALSTAACVATPFVFENAYTEALGISMFPEVQYGTRGHPVDYLQVTVAGSLAFSMAGLVLYLTQRMICLWTWLRSAALAATAALYTGLICLMPLAFAATVMEFPELRAVTWLQETALQVAMVSPAMVVMAVFRELGGDFPAEPSLAPFFVTHAVLAVLLLVAIRRRGRRVRSGYLNVVDQEGG